ncbi:ATP-binding protein [Pseudactinotalea sp. HY158]|uniref:ATP-binding protein n=1 Tax=Pseudactinotalea sp. HY158 TaxID=2654547 RepID=UPI001E4F0C40|nr:ATP-binding protein [Pseudactinotalea sp. HY158]
MTPTPRPELRRPHAGRRLAGVCAGLADHLGLPVRSVRWAFVGATVALGAGALMYAWLWAVVPGGDTPGPSRLAPRLRSLRTRVSNRELVLAGALLAVAVLLLALRGNIAGGASWIIAFVLVCLGAALAWSELGRGDDAARPRSVVLARVVAGCGLAAVGVVLFAGRGRTLDLIVWAAGVGLLLVAAVAVVLAPVGLRMWQDLGSERAARARESERADIAAHLHDSVLQTLALIRSRAEDPEAVRRLARSQERQLRDWLYTDPASPEGSIARQVEAVAAEVEERYGRQIDAITVGDDVPGAGAAALVAATREALTNAVRHGAAPVSLYLEVAPAEIEVYVRDRGEGFDLEAVPADRHGVRESIVMRMRRHGGSARIRTGRGQGTEVRLAMPRAGARDPAARVGQDEAAGPGGHEHRSARGDDREGVR